MHIRNYLSEFLYDKKNFIAFFENNIFIYKYKEIINITSKEITIKFDNNSLKISGNNLLVKKLSKDEILINGNIQKVIKQDE